MAFFVVRKLVGLGGFEPPTSPLSGVRSNQLSYRPFRGLGLLKAICVSTHIKMCLHFIKEVIQPQVPLRLPCYDLAPVTDLTFGMPESARLRVLPASMA